MKSVTTKDEFKTEVLENKQLVLVDFWAPWCPPCRMMSPILEEVQNALDGTVQIVKINVDESPENAALAQEYGVQGIPNMQVFKDGEVVDTLVGMRPKQTLIDELKKHI